MPSSDLKLENFLFEGESATSPLILIDFGLSKLFDKGERIRQRVGSCYYTGTVCLLPCLGTTGWNYFTEVVWEACSRHAFSLYKFLFSLCPTAQTCPVLSSYLNCFFPAYYTVFLKKFIVFYTSKSTRLSSCKYSHPSRYLVPNKRGQPSLYLF